MITAIFFFVFQLFAPPLVEWQSPVQHDFGELRQGVPGKVEFRFKNISAEPIIIDAVRTTCGCTAAEYPEIPILPGESERILIEFDARKTGWFDKKIKVFFHGQRKPEVLGIEGLVE